MPSVSADYLITHFDYSLDASMLLVDAALKLPEEEVNRDLKSSHGGIRGTLDHLYLADQVWLFRHTDTPHSITSTIPSEPRSVAQLKERWPSLFEKFKQTIADLGDEGIQQDFTYRNFAGKVITCPRWKTLLHIVNHGSIHRGQVMTMFRQLGHQPPSTDLIAYLLR